MRSSVSPEGGYQGARPALLGDLRTSRMFTQNVTQIEIGQPTSGAKCLDFLVGAGRFELPTPCSRREGSP